MRQLNARVNKLKSGRKLAVLLILALFLTGTLLTGSSALGSPDSLNINKMRISVWPEYDNPRILVIYSGEFAQSSPFPQQVRFLVPAGVEISQVCALRQPENEHLCQLYQTTNEGDYLAIDYSLPLPVFYLEFYYDAIKGQPDKSFAYQFESKYGIDKLEIEIQQPLRSSSFQLSPSSSSITSGSDGFKYYHYNFDGVTPGQVISFKGNYSKADSKPSITTNPKTGANSTLSVVLAVIGVVALGTVGWMLLRRPRQRLAPRAAVSNTRALPRASQKPVARTNRPATANQSRKASFCSNCGLKLKDGDNFCAGCGTPARKLD